MLVRVCAATVGWGDCKLRSGALQDFYDIRLPKIPGRYGSGIIAALGAGVTTWRVGQEVVFATLHTESGSAAEYVSLNSDRLAPKPKNMNHAQTASLLQGAVSAYACLIQTAEVGCADKVLIHGGAGSVGSACVELAHHLGCSITSTCRAIDREYVRSLGAQHVICFDEADFSTAVTNQDAVIDLVGGEVHRSSFTVLRAGGRLVYLNADPLPPEAPPNTIRIVNARIGNDGMLLSKVCELAERQVFSASIGAVLALADGAQAHKLLESRAIRRGRIVLSIGGQV
ncbi:MAG: NADP-dependent oxidoreductase [Xanthobacteraceae bacterium]